jgi:hypothetical protein
LQSTVFRFFCDRNFNEKMDEELYDEFGNYVGPEMNDSDESSEEEHEEEQDEEDERSEQGATAGPLVSFPFFLFSVVF